MQRRLFLKVFFLFANSGWAAEAVRIGDEKYRDRLGFVQREEGRECYKLGIHDAP